MSQTEPQSPSVGSGGFLVPLASPESVGHFRCPSCGERSTMIEILEGERFVAHRGRVVIGANDPGCPTPWRFKDGHWWCSCTFLPHDCQATWTKTVQYAPEPLVAKIMNDLELTPMTSPPDPTQKLHDGPVLPPEVILEAAALGYSIRYRTTEERSADKVHGWNHGVVLAGLTEDVTPAEMISHDLESARACLESWRQEEQEKSEPPPPKEPLFIVEHDTATAPGGETWYDFAMSDGVDLRVVVDEGQGLGGVPYRVVHYYDRDTGVELPKHHDYRDAVTRWFVEDKMAQSAVAAEAALSDDAVERKAAWDRALAVEEEVVDKPKPEDTLFQALLPGALFTSVMREGVWFKGDSLSAIPIDPETRAHIGQPREFSWKDRCTPWAEPGQTPQEQRPMPGGLPPKALPPETQTRDFYAYAREDRKKVTGVWRCGECGQVLKVTEEGPQKARTEGHLTLAGTELDRWKWSSSTRAVWLHKHEYETYSATKLSSPAPDANKGTIPEAKRIKCESCGLEVEDNVAGRVVGGPCPRCTGRLGTNLAEAHTCLPNRNEPSKRYVPDGGREREGLGRGRDKVILADLIDVLVGALPARALSSWDSAAEVRQMAETIYDRQISGLLGRIAELGATRHNLTTGTQKVLQGNVTLLGSSGPGGSGQLAIEGRVIDCTVAQIRSLVLGQEVNAFVRVRPHGVLQLVEVL